MVEVGMVVKSIEGDIVLFDNGEVYKLGKIKPKPEKTIPVVAFTGMKLGDLEVVKETEKKIEAVRGDGKKLIFDKATGLQTNCKNPRFANRIAQ